MTVPGDARKSGSIPMPIEVPDASTPDPAAQGRELERAGDLDGAYRAYAAAGLLDETVRLLSEHGRKLDAADIILGWVTRRPRPLNEHDRAWALRCARLFDEGGQAVRACDVLSWLGAYNDGTPIVQRLLEAGSALEAGACLVRLGDPQRGIELIMPAAPKGDARYAQAVLEVARGLARGAPITMDIDRWLADFIRTGPDDEAGAEALYSVAAAFAREGMAENAVECLLRVDARVPGFRDAKAQAERLEAGVRGAVTDFARVLEEDARFNGAIIPPKPAASPAPPPMTESATIITDNPETNGVAGAIAESFAPGVVLAKRYRLEQLIGRGGMSLVYRATDMELSDVVALKIFTQPTNEDALARFKQEVLLARQLIHRNVIRVYDIGTALGARFLTMELLVGEDLHSKMSRGISLREGIDYLIQACAGLEAAHQVGIVHRDIKPENLFVTKENAIKVTDFGIAKATFEKGRTVAGMVVGTPEYMAPEQAHGHMNVTPSADLYSLGIILYYLSTGTLPFRHSELVPLLMMQVTQPPEAPRKRNPALPPDVEELVLSLLDKDPGMRPPSARALGERLIDLRLRNIV